MSKSPGSKDPRAFLMAYMYAFDAYRGLEQF